MSSPSGGGGGFIDYSNRTNKEDTVTQSGSGSVDHDTSPTTKKNALGLENTDTVVDGSGEGGGVIVSSSDLKRSLSNGSRFTENLHDDDDDDRVEDLKRREEGAKAGGGIKKRLSLKKNGGGGSGGGGILFRRKSTTSSSSKQHQRSPSITTSLEQITSNDSSLSAHSRRVPPSISTSPATTSFAKKSPSIPSTTSSPKVIGGSPQLGPTVGILKNGGGGGKSPSPRSPTFSTFPSSNESNSQSHSRSQSQQLHPTLSSPSSSPLPTTKITPQDRHYLVRILTNLQFQREFSALSQIGTLSYYGDPFLPHSNGPNSKPKELLLGEKNNGWFGFLGGGGGTGKKEREKEWEGYEWDEKLVVESPLCRYLYWRFIANMPALRTAKPSYWQDQIQPFFDSFAERDLSSTKERGEITKRRMLATGITRIIGSYLSTSIRAIGPSAPSRPSTTMMHRVDLLVPPGSMDSMSRLILPKQTKMEYNAWVAVVEEMKRNGETFFRIISRVLVAENQPLFHTLQSWTSIVEFSRSLSSVDPRNQLDLPILPFAQSSRPANRSIVQTWIRQIVILLSSPSTSINSDVLSECRNLLESFLLSGGGGGGGGEIRTKELEEWALRGEEMDRDGEKLFRKWVGMGRRVRELRTTWIKYRKALIESDELDKTMVLVKKHSSVKAFPKDYRDAEEWAKIWVAYAFHYIFVASANGAEVLNILRGFHELIPYGAIKVGLALVNPTLAIRAIVQLVLGQPAGQQSLFQRIWSIIVGAAIKHQKKLIEAYKKKVSRASIADVLEQHVRASYVERQKTKQAAIDNDEDIVLTIMRERGSGSDIELVDRWHQEFKNATASRTAGTTKFEDVKNLLAAYYRMRDREQVLAIALEPNTPRLLHASIAVFYDTIYKVANASKLSERVGDIQAFLDDLIKVSTSAKKDPSEFIKLADRHHEKLYYFMHELAANGGELLQPLIDWSKSGLEFINSGIPPAAATSSPYKRTGVDIDSILDDLPSSSANDDNEGGGDSSSRPPTKESVLKEARHFANWTRYKKMYHDLCLRIDLLEAEVGDDTSGKRELVAMKLDKAGMWQELLAGDREAVRMATMEKEKEGERAKARTDAGGDLEWAWWSHEELAGAAGNAKVTISLPSTSTSSDSSSSSGGGGDKKNPTTTKKLTRSKSGSQRKASVGDDFHFVDSDEYPSSSPASSSSRTRSTEGEQLEIPAPSIKATKSLLSKYLEQVEDALKDAKKNKIK